MKTLQDEVLAALIATYGEKQAKIMLEHYRQVDRVGMEVYRARKVRDDKAEGKVT